MGLPEEAGMTPTVRIELEGEPRGKGRPRFTRQGHASTDAATRNYEAALKLKGREAMRGRAAIKGPLAVVVLAAFAPPASWSKKKRAAALAGAERPDVTPDADNILKALDALNKVVWVDDAQIVRAIIDKVYSARPRLVVDVYLPGGGAP